MAYHLERAAREYGQSFVEAMLKARRRITAPVTKVLFFVQQTAITPWEAYVYTQPSPERLGVDDADVAIELSHSVEGIPPTCDDEDAVLDRFLAEHGLEDALSWGSPGESFPTNLLHHELISAVLAGRAELEAKGLKFAQDALFAFWDEDKVGVDSTDTLASLEKRLRRELSELGLSAAAQTELATLLYDEEDKRRWFIGLFAA